MNRRPPAKVIKKLRAEVGFVCPIPDCNSPYLEWHHFDPPWNLKQHHDPKGMIALCIEHHKKADNDSFTKEQLRFLKKNAIKDNSISSGKFDWMRNEIILVMGGNIFMNTQTAIRYKNKKIIWFNRDENNNLLLNIDMFSGKKRDKLIMRDNLWYCLGKPEDIHCPPSGKELKVIYPDGDFVKIRFQECNDKNSLHKKYSDFYSLPNNIVFPVTTIEIDFYQEKYGFKIKAKNLEIPGENSFRNCIFEGVGIHRT
jgi:hypothetical protein